MKISCYYRPGVDEGIDIGYSASGGVTLSESEAAANHRNTCESTGGAQVAAMTS